MLKSRTSQVGFFQTTNLIRIASNLHSPPTVPLNHTTFINYRSLEPIKRGQFGGHRFEEAPFPEKWWWLASLHLFLLTGKESVTKGPPFPGSSHIHLASYLLPLMPSVMLMNNLPRISHMLVGILRGQASWSWLIGTPLVSKKKERKKREQQLPPQCGQTSASWAGLRRQSSQSLESGLMIGTLECGGQVVVNCACFIR